MASSQFGEKMFAMDTTHGHDKPARSPDMNPMDYFCWGYLKSDVFTPKPPNMEQLKIRIRQELANLILDQEGLIRFERQVPDSDQCFIE